MFIVSGGTITRLYIARYVDYWYGSHSTKQDENGTWDTNRLTGCNESLISNKDSKSILARKVCTQTTLSKLKTA